MSTKERERHYREAVRYLQNANDLLKTKARKKDRYYQDAKYVKMACGTAYSGVLMAVDTFLEMKGQGIEKKKYARINVDDYRKRLTTLDKKMLNDFNTAYFVLHLNGYYEGVTNADVIIEGMNSAKQIVNKIKPELTEDLLS